MAIDRKTGIANPDEPLPRKGVLYSPRDTSTDEIIVPLSFQKSCIHHKHHGCSFLLSFWEKRVSEEYEDVRDPDVRKNIIKGKCEFITHCFSTIVFPYIDNPQNPQNQQKMIELSQDIEWNHYLYATSIRHSENDIEQSPVYLLNYISTVLSSNSYSPNFSFFMNQLSTIHELFVESIVLYSEMWEELLFSKYLNENDRRYFLADIQENAPDLYNAFMLGLKNGLIIDDGEYFDFKDQGSTFVSCFIRWGDYHNWEKVRACITCRQQILPATIGNCSDEWPKRQIDLERVYYPKGRSEKVKVRKMAKNKKKHSQS